MRVIFKKGISRSWQHIKAGKAGKGTHKISQYLQCSGAEIFQTSFKMSHSLHHMDYHRTAYTTWITKLKTILSMFPSTMHLIGNDSITPFQDPNCFQNKTVFLLIGFKVDAFFLKAIMNHDGKCDKALAVIKTQCAHLGVADKHHFHHLFMTLWIHSDESATNFFCRFTFAHSATEAASNTYQEEELVNVALNGMSSKYEMVLHLYNLQCDSGSTYKLAEIETKFFTIDKKVSRDKTLTWIATRNMASGRPPNSSRPSKHVPRDAKDIICFKYGEPGHKSPDCPKGKGKTGEVANAANGNNSKKRFTKNSRHRKTDKAQPALVSSSQVIHLPADCSLVTWHDIAMEENSREKATEEYMRNNLIKENEYSNYTSVSNKFVSYKFKHKHRRGGSIILTLHPWLSHGGGPHHFSLHG